MKFKSITKEAINVGNATAKYFPNVESNSLYSRTIWDMQLYHGDIYLGYGNYTDNNGPVFIIKFLPGKEIVFVEDRKVIQEAVIQYITYGNILLCGGVDPTNNNVEECGYYYKKDEIWYQPYIYTYHVPGICAFRDSVVVCGTLGSESNVYINKLGTDVFDKIMTWKDRDIGFVNNCVNYKDEAVIVFSVDYEKAGDKKIGSYIMNIYDGQNVVRHKYNGEGLRGGAEKRLLVYKDKILFITSYLMRPDFAPYPLYYLDGPNDTIAKRIEMFIDSDVRDIVIKDDLCYVMTGVIRPSGDYIASIFMTEDIVNWELVASVVLPAMPYSFEIADAIYIGTGHVNPYAKPDKMILDKDAGSIYRAELPEVSVPSTPPVIVPKHTITVSSSLIKVNTSLILDISGVELQIDFNRIDK